MLNRWLLTMSCGARRIICSVISPHHSHPNVLSPTKLIRAQLWGKTDGVGFQSEQLTAFSLCCIRINIVRVLLTTNPSLHPSTKENIPIYTQDATSFLHSTLMWMLPWLQIIMKNNDEWESYRGTKIVPPRHANSSPITGEVSIFEGGMIFVPRFYSRFI